MRRWHVVAVLDNGLWVRQLVTQEDRPDLDPNTVSGVLGFIVFRDKRSFTGKVEHPADADILREVEKVRLAALRSGRGLTCDLDGFTANRR